MKDYFKYDEINEYFLDFVCDELFLALTDSDFRDELHFNAFNSDYYIIGTYRAEQWLGDKAFDVIQIIKEFEQFNFGEVTTDFSDPEKVVNMYAYIVGEHVVAEWLDDNPIKEDVKG